MQSSYIAQEPTLLTPANATSRSPQIDYSLGALIIALPILAAIGFITHRKHRSIKLRRQIVILERLWLLDTKERRS
jgi:hypothetical protein